MVLLFLLPMHLLLFQFLYISFPYNCLQSTSVVTLLLFIQRIFFSFHQSKIIGLCLYLSSVILEFDLILFLLFKINKYAVEDNDQPKIDSL